MSHSKNGIYAASGAFFIWGILVLYWKWLGRIPVAEIICHRILWSATILWLILFWQKQCRATFQHFLTPKLCGIHFVSGLLLSGNWSLYIWATLNDRIIEGALGYYLNPFFNMLFGSLIFKERYSLLQKISIVIAIIGVACQFYQVTSFPWVALCLAVSFSLYGVVRKKSPLPSLSGLTVETSLLLPISVTFLIFIAVRDNDPSHLFSEPALLTTGIVTACPLLLFGFAARNISLSTLGIMQFLGPTLQFIIGWQIYKEPLSPQKITSFALIWTAIALYCLAARKKREN